MFKQVTSIWFRCVECREYHNDLGVFQAELPPECDGTYIPAICETCRDHYSPRIRDYNPSKLLVIMTVCLSLGLAFMALLVLLNQ